ncbi:hypothetical protein [Rosistilla oblonga]|uniref:hypothetical protein n=1 Tax=Rosistilla oblonga TaxID=2527990 RepID=UPI003A97341F
MIDNWTRQQNKDGSPWAPRAGNPPNPPLIKTGAMFGAATDDQADGNIREVSDRSAKTGINSAAVPWAPMQQFGTSRIPARQYFFLYGPDRVKVRPPIQQAAGRVIISKMRRG